MARKSNPILDILQTVATIKDTNITKAKMPADKDIIRGAKLGKIQGGLQI